MNILLLNQFFWPDTVATSQILTEVARSLGETHNVTAICGGGSLENDCTAAPADLKVRIKRIRNLRFGRSVPARIASYGTYLLGTFWHACRAPKPDIIVTLTTPPVLHMIGSLIARLRGARHVLWEMDVYPDIATDIGFLKPKGPVASVSGAILDWSRRRADLIVALGDDMKARLMKRGIDAGKIVVSENWADGSQIVPLAFPDGPLTVHYSGNFGRAHELETISGIIDVLANNSEYHFIFSGGGVRRTQLENHCREMGIINVEFRAFCPISDLGTSLAEGHVGLVTQLPSTVGSIVPSKIYGIMAAGRPLLYIGPAGSTASNHIDRFKCGWRIDPGDITGGFQLLGALNGSRDLLLDAGERGRRAFESFFDRSMGVARTVAMIVGDGLEQRAPSGCETKPPSAESMVSEAEELFVEDEREIA